MRLFFGGGQPGSQLPPTSTSTSTWPHGQRPRTNTWPGSRSRAHEPSASAPMNTTPGPHRRTPPMDIMPCSARQRATSCDLARARGPERGTGPDPPAPGGANESREPPPPPPRPRISAAHLENTEHSGRRKHLSLDFHSPLSPHLLAPGSLGRRRAGAGDDEDVEDGDDNGCSGDNGAARRRAAHSGPILPKTCANCGRSFFQRKSDQEAPRGGPCKTTMRELLPSPTHRSVSDMCSGECRWSYALNMRDRLGLAKWELRSQAPSSPCSSLGSR